MQNKTAGSSLIIVMLVSVIVIGSVIALISNTAGLARKGSGYERMAYSSMLSADAGLNSFAPRIQLARYTGRTEDFDCYVQGTRAPGNNIGICPLSMQPPGKLTAYTLPNGDTVDVRVVGFYSSSNTITLQSTSTSTSGNTKVLLEDFSVLKPPTTNLSIPAALTSFPNIDFGGNSKLYGAPGTSAGLSSTENGILPTLTNVGAGFTVPAVGSTVTVQFNSDSYLTSGSYVRINGYFFRLQERASNYSSTARRYILKRVPGPYTSSSSTNVTNNTAVDLVQFAVRSSAEGTTVTPVVASKDAVSARIRVSDPTGFYVGDVIYFRINSLMYSAQVTALGYESPGNLTTGYLDIKYPATAVGSGLTGTSSVTAALLDSLQEGTGISRYVPGASSAGGITGGGSSTLLPSAAAFNTNIKGGEQLFMQTFSGKTKQNVYDLSQRYDLPPATVLDQVNWVGPVNQFTTNNNSYSINDLCGTGILIVTGNLTLNGTCSKGGNFTGLLYVMGDFRNQGNAIVNGAVVVEGQVITSGTSAGGTMTINYDNRVFLERGRHLAVTRVTPLKATWRQR